MNGDRVMRLGSPNDYTTGRIGTICDIDYMKERAQVRWDASPKTWCKFLVLGKIA